MKRIATNSLTGWAAALVISYIIVGIVAPGIYVAAAVRIGLFASGVAALYKWWPAFRILLDREAPPHETGQIISTLGIAANALGVVYNACWWGLWVAMGTQADWTISAHSAFGNYLIVIGLTLVYLSTDIKRDVVRPVNWWVISGLLVVVSLAAFFLGTRWQATQHAAALNLASATVSANECPDETPIAGNQGRSGWIYHVPGGPWYGSVIAEECFQTEEQARVAGYRPAGR